MATLEITGMVPITVTVDLETGDVTEVHVWDEEAVLDPAPQGDQQYAAAVRAAEEGNWPAWEFGA